MRTRDMGFNDYGVEKEEAKRVVVWCKQLHPTDVRLKIYELALEVKASIADDLVYSLVKGLSYDDLVKIRNVEYNKNDFYAYRRQLIAKIQCVYNL